MTLIFWIRDLIHDSVAKHDFGESKTNPYLIPIQRNKISIFFLIFRKKNLLELIKFQLGNSIFNLINYGAVKLYSPLINSH